MAAMAALTAKSKMSPRAIAEAMRDLDPKHAWTKSGLQPYVAGKTLPPLDKKKHLRTLLLVLNRPGLDLEVTAPGKAKMPSRGPLDADTLLSGDETEALLALLSDISQGR